MANNRQMGSEITQQQFEKFLSKYYCGRLTANTDDPRAYVGDDVYEYCYYIFLTGPYGIKVYSSVSINTGAARADKDAIRLVAVRLDRELGQVPIRPAFPHVKRGTGWRENFDKRVLHIVYTLGNDMNCHNCRAQLVLRKEPKHHRHFLGCSRFPRCRGTRTITVIDRQLHRSLAPHHT